MPLPRLRVITPTVLAGHEPASGKRQRADPGETPFPRKAHPELLPPLWVRNCPCPVNSRWVRGDQFLFRTTRDTERQRVPCGAWGLTAEKPIVLNLKGGR